MGSIALRGVSKTYAGGALAAVNRVDLDIPDGEFVVFVGPSGCGKSTLLRMIAGLENITSGEIAINGTVVNEVAARNRDIAMVFQNYALYPQMTVRENISFALELRNLGKSEIDERVKEAARILDLRDLLNRKPSQLSGGQRQRVAMGRAIVRHPQAFLLDEPLSNLDAKLRVQLRAELVRLHARLGVTTIHVTHDQVEAMTLGSRVAVFSRGTLQQYDTPHQLYSHPANVFVAGFIGSPAMNFFEATLGPDGNAEIGSTLVQLGKAVSGTPGRKVILGVRPEHLSWRMPGSSPAPALAGKVDLIERLEPESFIAASLSDPALRLRLADEFTPGAAADPDSAALVARTVTIRAPADRLPLPGAAIDITIEPGRAHLFDAVTGAAL